MIVGMQQPVNGSMYVFILQLTAEKSLDRVSYFHYDGRDETASQCGYVCFISQLTAEK